jgi:hypothetical protein
MNDYELLLQEREEFENMIYDLLVTPLFIPDSFWDPVVICLSSEQIEIAATKLAKILAE